MKTTIEIPDDLMRRVKIRAIQEHKKLKDLIQEYLERGIHQPAQHEEKPWTPKVAKLQGRGPLTTDEIEEAINWGRE